MSAGRTAIVAPVPLVVLFGLFLAAMVYLVAASLTRRTAPVFPVSPNNRVRAANWRAVGDTLTIDATDGDRWQYVSLSRGGVLSAPDTAGWEVAVQRYRIITPPNGAVADLGPTRFASAPSTSTPAFQPTQPGTPPENPAIQHWYRYSLLTHLLEPNGHLFAVRTPAGAFYKVAIVSYYCPRLVAGCLTIRYGPVEP